MAESLSKGICLQGGIWGQETEKQVKLANAMKGIYWWCNEKSQRVLIQDERGSHGLLVSMAHSQVLPFSVNQFCFLGWFPSRSSKGNSRLTFAYNVIQKKRELPAFQQKSQKSISLDYFKSHVTLWAIWIWGWHADWLIPGAGVESASLRTKWISSRSTEEAGKGKNACWEWCDKRLKITRDSSGWQGWKNSQGHFLSFTIATQGETGSGKRGTRWVSPRKYELEICLWWVAVRSHWDNNNALGRKRRIKTHCIPTPR